MHRKTETNPDASVKQRARFIDAARALDADEDEAVFKAKLGAIARQQPAPEPPAEKPKRTKRAKE